MDRKLSWLALAHHRVLANKVTQQRVPFGLRYEDVAHARAQLAQPEFVLGVVGYGTGRPEFVPAGVAFIQAPLRPLGAPVLEIWRAAAPCRPVKVGLVVGACSENLIFGALTLAHASGPIEAVVERAYQEIFDFIEACGFPALLRVWNYLIGITDEEDGLQRYMRFNIGRAKAYAARLREAVPPAASGVGGHDGNSVIYFLAGREPARAIENARQVSAYHYPDEYGPRPPSFSRASLYQAAGGQAMFISGTASIVGHATCHVGDVAAQLAETGRNLAALMGAAGVPLAKDVEWSSKIYLRDPADQAAAGAAVDEIFGAGSARVFLQGDICRTELALEIEAFGVIG